MSPLSLSLSLSLQSSSSSLSSLSLSLSSSSSGIEAARATIINEFRNALSAFGIYVNYRHLACLADCMTFGGFLMAISRHGINRGMLFINIFIIII